MDLVVASVAALFVALGMISGMLQRSPITAPMLALGAGVALGPGASVLPTDLESSLVLLLAQLALAVVLFVDATRVDLALVRRNGQVPGRMLVLGLPLVVGLGTLAGMAVPGLTVGVAFVLACVLAPTDAALGQAVMTDQRIPVRVRQALNVESGLNDGLVVPFLTIALVVVDARSSAGSGSLAIEAVQLIGVGAVTGIAVGGGIGWAMRAIDWHSLEAAPRQVAAAALPLLAFGASGALGGNGFVAAFVAGIVFGTLVEDAHSLVEFGEDAGELLALATFLVFGSVFVGPAVEALSVRVVIYAAVSLTAVRMLPIALSLAGLHLRGSTVSMLGWFGPRGLASVVFGLEVLELAEAGAFPQGETLFGIAAMVVVTSVMLHGLSSRPLARAYAARLGQVGAESPMAEAVDVEELPYRPRPQS